MEMIRRMVRITRKLTLAASLTAVIVGLGTTAALAASDGDDSISPAGTSYKVTNTSNIVLRGKFNGFSATVTCKNSLIMGTTPVFGLGPANISKPSFTNCTDSFGGTDTVTTNMNNGPWQVTFIDVGNDEDQAEPNFGDEIQVTIPKAGATLKILNCTLTVAPSQSANVAGLYDDRSVLTFSNAVVPISMINGNGCTASSATLSGSYAVSPNLQDVS